MGSPESALIQLLSPLISFKGGLIAQIMDGG